MIEFAHKNGTAFGDLANVVDLSEHQRRFTDGNAENTFDWQSYFVLPGLKCAWVSLEYPLTVE